MAAQGGTMEGDMEKISPEYLLTLVVAAIALWSTLVVYSTCRRFAYWAEYMSTRWPDSFSRAVARGFFLSFMTTFAAALCVASVHALFGLTSPDKPWGGWILGILVVLGTVATAFAVDSQEQTLAKGH